jgi:predicted dehydrogenase
MIPQPPVEEISRRRFLHRVGQGFVAANLAAPLLRAAQSRATAPDPPGKKLGWAVVGLGSLSIHQILPAFAGCEKSRVTALVSGHPDKAQKLALRYGVDANHIYNYENYDSIQKDPEVDVIYIVLPNGMHAEYTIRGLQAGKHVLCEKPMANTPADCQKMIDASRAANRKLMVAYRCRYELGPTQTILTNAGWHIDNPDQWRLKKDLAGGGSLMDIGIYALNAARYLSGEEPAEVNAMMYSTPGDPRFKEVEENINFQLRFPSGVLALCSSSYGYYHQSHFRLLGTTGLLELDPATWYSGLRLRVQHGTVLEERELPVVDHFAAEMDHLSGCVMENKEPLTPGEEGLRDVKIMMAIYEAATAGKTVRL